jgi:hypothetical protein
MYNSRDVRYSVRTPYLLLALLVAAFITLYPQLEAAGYCGDGSCPKVSHSAPASGPASGALVASGASFVVAVLVAIPTIARVPRVPPRALGAAARPCRDNALTGDAPTPASYLEP